MFRLAFTPVQSNARPSDARLENALILHGVLGSGQNFRGFARKLTELRPDYRFLLVDLRHHGQSAGAPPPDTVTACAEDLSRLIATLGEEHPEWGAVRTVIGHSFGGKVGLELARLRVEEGPSVETPSGGADTQDLAQLWVLDSDPGEQAPDENHEIARVIRAVRAIPMPVFRRDDVVKSLTSQGLSSGLANWMTTNLKRSGDGYTWTFDLDRIERLLADYFQRDLWPFLTAHRTGSPDIHLVVADRSERWSPAMRERAETLSQAGGASYHLIENAGHWLHVDNPEALLALLAKHLP